MQLIIEETKAHIEFSPLLTARRIESDRLCLASATRRSVMTEEHQVSASVSSEAERRRTRKERVNRKLQRFGRSTGCAAFRMRR